MKDSTKAELLQCTPMHAEGKFCIDLTDPVTGKVTDRRQAKNHVFPIGIWGAQASNYNIWSYYVDNVYMVLTDSTREIDPNFPFLMGMPVGFGIPSNPGVGLYRGAYNAANQVLHASTTSSIRWKFQYDFTTAQANGTIGTIGLTQQYNQTGRTSNYNFYGSTINVNYLGTSDGYCSYNGAYPNYGNIVKRDAYANATTTIDVSALITGGSSTCLSPVYDASTGKYGILRHYPGSATYRQLYMFTDNTFTSISATYPASSVIPKLSYGSYPCYIYGDYLFITSGKTVMVFHYKTDTYVTTLTHNGFSGGSGSGIELAGNVEHGSLVKGRYLFWGMMDNSNSGSYFVVFDMSAQQFVAFGARQWSIYRSYLDLAWDYFHPDMYLPAVIPSNSVLSIASGAMAARKLEAPVTKTSANGMTVTYELEVFW